MAVRAHGMGTPISDPAARKYLLVKGRSGLGNRMLAAMTGILYARLAGRSLVVDWSDDAYSDDGSNVFHRFFVCPSFPQGDAVPATDSVSPDAWRGHLHESTRELEPQYRHPVRARLVRSSWRRRSFQRGTSIDLSRLDHDAQVAVWWGYNAKIDLLRPHFRGELAGLSRMSTPAILTTLLRHELLLHPDIQSRVDEFRSRHLGGRTVGVHLRLSDRRVQVQAILNALDVLLEREPDLKVFGATDNIEAKELLEQRHREVVMTPHWYPAPGRPLHQNRDCPDRIENGVEALVDLYLLGGCDYLIGDTASSFTRIAGLLLPEPEGRLVDLRPGPDLQTRLLSRVRRRHPRLTRSVYRAAGLSP